MHELLSQFIYFIELVGRSDFRGGREGCPGGCFFPNAHGTQPALSCVCVPVPVPVPVPATLGFS